LKKAEDVEEKTKEKRSKGRKNER